MPTMILVSLNLHRKHCGWKPTAVGPLREEFARIQSARKVFQDSSQECQYHNFIAAFNKTNYFSMVGYAVGMHDDHFHNGESLEGKTLFTIPKQGNGSTGCGGSVVGGRYVFGLTSWN